MTPVKSLAIDASHPAPRPAPARPGRRIDPADLMEARLGAARPTPPVVFWRGERPESD